MGLSAVIITLNEEKNIASCLKALQGIADEIIVIDSMSTDRTEEICKNFPVTFVSTQWQGYSRTKNYGNSLATNEHILSVDADEVLSEKLRASILAIKDNLKGLYSFNRLTNYAGKWVRFCGWYPDRKVRIFPKNQTQWVGDFVHETLEHPKDLPIHFLKGDLLHYSYHSREAHKNRIERYSTLHAEKLFSENKPKVRCKLYYAPVFKFLRDYLFKMGFLDGKTGLQICLYSALAVYLKYKKLKTLQNQK